MRRISDPAYHAMKQITAKEGNSQNPTVVHQNLNATASSILTIVLTTVLATFGNPSQHRKRGFSQVIVWRHSAMLHNIKNFQDHFETDSYCILTVKPINIFLHNA